MGILLLMTVLRLLAAAPYAHIEPGESAESEAPVSLPASSECSMSLPRASILGDVDKQIIRRISAHHRPALCRCANKAPQATSTSVTVAYVIDPAGEVPRARVASSTAPKAVARCIAAEIESWSFPRGPCGLAQIEQTIEILPPVKLPPGPK